MHIHGKEITEIFVNGEFNITATSAEYNKTAIVASNQCLSDNGFGFKFQLVEGGKEERRYYLLNLFSYQLQVNYS